VRVISEVDMMFWVENFWYVGEEGCVCVLEKEAVSDERDRNYMG
jgi:hypothetical protein